MIDARKIIIACFIVFFLLANVSLAFAEENEVSQSASQAIGFSGGWISGNGVTYRRYFGKHFLQGTFFGVISDNGDNTYINTAFSGGTYLHKLEASDIMPPLGLKIMAGVDLVVDRSRETEFVALPGDNATTRTINEDMSYYGAGVGIDFGNPGQPGLSLWVAVNYVFAFEGISSPSFDWFGARPAGGILYGW